MSGGRARSKTIRYPRATSPLAWIILAITVVASAGSFLLPAIQLRHRGPRNTCANNLRNVAIALRQYHEDYGCFPQAYIADSSGRPMHSWRVFLLPYLERNDLYLAYRFDEPWNSPHNREIGEHMPNVFRCPNHETHQNETVYLAVVGDAGLWSGAKSSCLADVKDGPEKTILLVESLNSVNWLEPLDMSWDQALRGINVRGGLLAISSVHPGGATVAFCDGRIRFLSEETSLPVLKGLLTISGGEAIDESQY